MIYVCLVTQDHDATIGLVLWKIRQVFDGSGREYQILAVDDASVDRTPEVLGTYRKALPLTIQSHATRQGYAISLEEALREALERTDRPRRDLAVTLPADLSASPAVLLDIVKRFESGADVVVGEAAGSTPSLGMRLVRRSAPWLLKPGLSVPGLNDPTSGITGMRLITLKHCLQSGARLLETEGLSANAELVARVAQQARQIAVVTVGRPPQGAAPVRREGALAAAVSLFRAGRRLRIPTPSAQVQRS